MEAAISLLQLPVSSVTTRPSSSLDLRVKAGRSFFTPHTSMLSMVHTSQPLLQAEARLGSG